LIRSSAAWAFGFTLHFFEVEECPLQLAGGAGCAKQTSMRRPADVLF
jgi:hypothetical protein